MKIKRKIALGLILTGSAFAQGLTPGANGSNDAGADLQSNVGSAVTNPSTSQGPTSRGSEPLVERPSTSTMTDEERVRRGVAGEQPRLPNSDLNNIPLEDRDRFEFEQRAGRLPGSTTRDPGSTSDQDTRGAPRVRGTPNTFETDLNADGDQFDRGVDQDLE
ncbi:MAG: hypothetical protein AB1540_14940 [Bdellovibrionota bacterium]